MTEYDQEKAALSEIRGILQRGETSLSGSSRQPNNGADTRVPLDSATEAAARLAAHVIQIYPLENVAEFSRKPNPAERWLASIDTAQRLFFNLLPRIFLKQPVPLSLARYERDPAAKEKLGIYFTAETLVMCAFFQPLSSKRAASEAASAFMRLSPYDVATLQALGPNIPPARLRRLIISQHRDAKLLESSVRLMEQGELGRTSSPDQELEE